MNTSIPRLMFAFAAVFAALVIALLIYWFFWQRPQDDCEGAGNWWDPGSRVCGRVVLISDFTGRYHRNGRVDREAVRIPDRPPPSQPLPER